MQDLQEFKEYLIEREKSDKTIIAYLRDVRQFKEFLKEKDSEDIHNNIIKEYREYLLYKRFLTPTTANRKLVAIHQYCAFNEINTLNIRVKVQMQNFLENVITKEETERMIDIAKQKRDYRAIALIKGLELTGLRIFELLQITINDINKSSIQIVGKGNKIRSVFIPSSLNKVWRQYCRSGRKKNQSDALFIGKRGKMTESGTDRIIKKYAELANVPIEKAHHHSWRHRYILRLLDRGVSLEETASLVGHATVNQTAQYARKTKEQLLSIIEDLD
jgi:integrase/recombinase XerD